jgi:hypothetical protein
MDMFYEVFKEQFAVCNGFFVSLSCQMLVM